MHPKVLAHQRSLSERRALEELTEKILGHRHEQVRLKLASGCPESAWIHRLDECTMRVEHLLNSLLAHPLGLTRRGVAITAWYCHDVEMPRDMTLQSLMSGGAEALAINTLLDIANVNLPKIGGRLV